jgi:transposase-like protein
MQCACPQCESKAFKRNGYTRHGKQNHRCLDCGRQFSLDIFHFVPQDTCIEIVETKLTEHLPASSSI